MNWFRNARAALVGIAPHQPEKHIRYLQHAYIMELFRYERSKDSQRVNDETWKYLEIHRKH